MGRQVPRSATSATVALVAAGMILGACGSSSKSSSNTSTASTVAGTSSGGSSGGSTPSGSVINVGVIASLTGPQASSTDQAATVAPAWAEWVNANGGVSGHPVKVYVEDDKNDPAAAQAAGQDLISSKKVVAIVVGSDNLVTAFDGAAISAGVPVISGTGNSTDWYTKAGMFPTTTGIFPGLGAQIAVAKQYGHATKFANLYCAEVAACAQANPILSAAAKSAGVGYTQLAISSTAPSYTAQCVQLQQEKVDYAQLNFTTAAAVKFVQDCQAQGYNPTWGSSEQAAGAGYASLPNFTMYGPAYAFPSVANAAPVATFRAAMQKYATNGNWKEGTASYTWQGLQTLAQALSGVATPTRQDVVAGLDGFKNQNLGGLLANGVTYPSGKPVGFPFNPCYFVVGMKGGQVTAPANLTPQCPTGSS